MGKTIKKYNTIAGLPRSGSTLLTAILNQNPKFYASETSALCRILTGVRRGWETVTENKTSPKLEVKKNVLKSIVDGYYKHIDKEVIFDKNRVWNEEVGLSKLVFGEDTKVILCVRNLTDILSSFEKLNRKSESFLDTVDKINFPKKSNTIEGRCELWSSNSGVLGSCVNSMSQLWYKDCNYLILEFDDLTKDPEFAMKKVYQFLEEDYYEHDFDNVINPHDEKDEILGMPDLHVVGKKVVSTPEYLDSIIGKSMYNKYKGFEFWRTNREVL